MIRANSYRVSEVKATLRLPHDYAYDDAKPKSVVKPAVLWGEVPSKAKKASPRRTICGLADQSGQRAVQQHDREPVLETIHGRRPGRTD